MGNWDKMCQDIVDNIGGKENIANINHCATRLRIRVKDGSLVNSDGLSKADKLLGLKVSGDELQCIVGLEVESAYLDFVKFTGIEGSAGSSSGSGQESKAAPVKQKQKQKITPKAILDKCVDFLSGTLVPVIPMFIASGMLLAIITLCENFLGLDPDSGTVVVLDAIGNAGLYFMPILIGYSCAKKLEIEPVLGAFLGAVLCYSTISGAEGLSFLGIPVATMSYNNTLLPILLGCIFMSFVYKFLKKFIADAVRYFLLPTLTMIITVPVTLLILGPLGNFLGGYLALLIQWLSETFGFLAVGIWAAFCPIGIMTGMDKAVYMLNLENLATVGYDPLALPGGLAGNAAIGGAALAVWLLSRDTETKSLGASSGITAILGITEPALYGLCVRWQRVLLGAMAGAGIGGCFAGLVHLKQYAYAGPGLMTCALYISPDGSMFNFAMCFVTIAISAVAGLLMTILFCRGQHLFDAEPAAEGSAPAVKTTITAPKTKGAMTLKAYCHGKVISITEVKDETFANKVMGDGLAIEPTGNTVVAPADGVVSMVAEESGHAVGLTLNNGAEILIHVGLDTVDMKGDGFSVHVKEGQKVQSGDKLITFDAQKIRNAGHEATCVMVLLNGDEFPDAQFAVGMNAMRGSTVIAQI